MKAEDIKPEDSTCDFCDQPLEPGKWELFHARARYSIPLEDGRELVDDGEWLACPDCSPLVREGKWIELAQVVNFKTGASIKGLLVIWANSFGEDVSYSPKS